MQVKVGSQVEQSKQQQSNASLHPTQLLAPQSTIEDLRPETVQLQIMQAQIAGGPQQRTLMAMQAKMNNSPQIKNVHILQARMAASQLSTRNLTPLIASPAIQRIEDEESLQGQFETDPVQRELANSAPEQEPSSETPKPNNTGLPNQLKAGIESLSGVSMDHVKVHYNSDRPVQLNAHAYAQGTDIHLAPGQEKHLPHEAWHVVQQAQGRVKPTMQMKDGAPVNDDAGLECEADVMGAKAVTEVNMSDTPGTFQRRAEVAYGGEPVTAGLTRADPPVFGPLGELPPLINAAAPAQRLVAFQPALAARAPLPVNPPIQFGGRYEVPKKNGKGMERKSISSMSAEQLDYFLNNYPHAAAEDIEAAKNALIKKELNVAANTKDTVKAEGEERDRLAREEREALLISDPDYAMAKAAADKIADAEFKVMTDYAIDLVNEVNLGRLTEQRLEEIRSLVMTFFENLTLAKVEAERRRLDSVDTFARAGAVQAHHREFQRIHLSLARFGSANEANAELLKNPIAFEGANPDLKYDVETDHTRLWSGALGYAQIADFMGDDYARILVNKMAKFITGKDDLIEKYLKEMGLAVKNAMSIAGDGLKRAFTDILRGNSLSGFIGPVAELQELNAVIARGELKSGTQIELGEKRPRPKVEGMNPDTAETQEVDLGFVSATGQRQLREVKADPITMEAALVQSGNPSDQMLSYGSLRADKPSPSKVDVRADTAGTEVIWACPSAKDWPVLFLGPAGQFLLDFNFMLSIAGQQFGRAEITTLVKEVPVKLAVLADPDMPNRITCSRLFGTFPTPQTFLDSL